MSHSDNLDELGKWMLILGTVLLLRMSFALMFSPDTSGPALLLAVFLSIVVAAMVDRSEARPAHVALLAGFTYCTIWPLAIALTALGLLVVAAPLRFRALLVHVATALALGYLGWVLSQHVDDARRWMATFFGWSLGVHAAAVIAYLNYFARRRRPDRATGSAPDATH